MRGPPITITCDCGARAELGYGDRWTCEACGRTWDTNQVPRAEYDQLVRSARLYGAATVGPPILLAAVFIPLTVAYGARFAFLLFAFVLAYALLVVPPIRRHANRRIRASAPRWKLRPE